ncbi:hypothetical protein KC362_g16983 [Hortaea werneckii]|nr:hypothetical protein KC362_g16983 [Hortaea werneckii]
MAPKAVKYLDIAIVGAGMGGLATALALAKQGFKNIHVYEYASNLGFVGAGIQLAPNMARVLDRLGCWADIEKDAVDLKDTSIRRKEAPCFTNGIPEENISKLMMFCRRFNG